MLETQVFNCGCFIAGIGISEEEGEFYKQTLDAIIQEKLSVDFAIDDKRDVTFNGMTFRVVVMTKNYYNDELVNRISSQTIPWQYTS